MNPTKRITCLGSPEVRQKRSDAARKAWSRPDYRAKVIEAQKRAAALRRARDLYRP